MVVRISLDVIEGRMNDDALKVWGERHLGSRHSPYQKWKKEMPEDCVELYGKNDFEEVQSKRKDECEKMTKDFWARHHAEMDAIPLKFEDVYDIIVDDCPSYDFGSYGSSESPEEWEMVNSIGRRVGEKTMIDDSFIDDVGDITPHPKLKAFLEEHKGKYVMYNVW